MATDDDGAVASLVQRQPGTKSITAGSAINRPDREDRPIPRYYFNIRRKDGLTKDPAAVELPDIEEARRIALSHARELLALNIARGEIVCDDVFEICDEHEHVLASVPFRQALRLHGT